MRHFSLVSTWTPKNSQFPNKNPLFVFVSSFHSLVSKNVQGVLASQIIPNAFPIGFKVKALPIPRLQYRQMTSDHDDGRNWYGSSYSQSESHYQAD
jgi:hypothetical protein